MIDLIPGVTFTDTDKQVYGAIAGSLAGAALGALLGALTAFIIARSSRNKEIELQKINENRQIMKEDGFACRLANTYLMNLLIKNAANRQHTKDLSKGILDDQNNTVFQINIPQIYSKTPELSNNLINEEVLALWASLSQEIDLQNNNVSSFNAYYDLLRKTVHAQVFTSNQSNLNKEAIDSDNAMIIDAMKSQQRAHDAFRSRCIRLVATLLCYNKYYLKFDLRDSKSLAEYREAITKMESYKPTKKALEKSIAKVEKVYDDTGIFKSEAYSVQDESPA